MKKITGILILFVIANMAFANDSLINREDSKIKFFLESELGTVKVNYHTILIGSESEGTGTTFDYVTEGGQEILYKFERFNLGFILDKQYKFSFLYQPLEVVTEVTFKEDVKIDNVTFASGTPMEVSYGFPFYRITYGYDFFPADEIDLGIGGALQLRNASLVFKEIAGDQMTVSQNLGPVPAINLFGKYTLNNGLFFQTDITGLYASSAFINGADFEFEGSILDASLRTGYTLKHDIDLFLNLRFLGGSAAGKSEYDYENWTDSVEKETANYLATTSLTFGITIR
ncbi:MAG: hypothetical protein JEY99_05115 [Spirochaetales bacterium]|nr:hypothetical protein [Spirochaetales bacterium]